MGIESYRQVDIRSAEQMDVLWTQGVAGLKKWLSQAAPPCTVQPFHTDPHVDAKPEDMPVRSDPLNTVANSINREVMMIPLQAACNGSID